MSFANLTMKGDQDLPETSDYECPDDAVSLIEEYHQGLHKVLISKESARGRYKPVGTIICQNTKDKHTRPDANPDEIGEAVMIWIQYEVEETDDPGNYKMEVVGPPGKGTFRKTKHIDIRSADGIARSKAMLSEGDMLEQQTEYISSLHEQLTGMVDLVLASYKTVVGENREMMKILSEATRKHGDIEAQRLAHQLNMRIHDDEIKHQDSEAERSLQKFREGLSVFKETNAAEELVRAVARKIQGVKDASKGSSERTAEPRGDLSPTPPGDLDPVDPPEEEEVVETTAKGKKKVAKKKAAKKKTTKEAAKKTPKKGRFKKKEAEDQAEKPELSEEDELDEGILAEGRELVLESPLVMAAEALKMSINQNSQWGMLRKHLNEEQLDILDEIFASTTEDEVRGLAQRLYDAKGMLKLISLKEHLDTQQQAFIGLVLSDVKR